MTVERPFPRARILAGPAREVISTLPTAADGSPGLWMSVGIDGDRYVPRINHFIRPASQAGPCRSVDVCAESSKKAS